MTTPGGPCPQSEEDWMKAFQQFQDFKKKMKDNCAKGVSDTNDILSTIKNNSVIPSAFSNDNSELKTDNTVGDYDDNDEEDNENPPFGGLVNNTQTTKIKTKTTTSQKTSPLLATNPYVDDSDSDSSSSSSSSSSDDDDESPFTKAPQSDNKTLPNDNVEGDSGSEYDNKESQDNDDDNPPFSGYKYTAFTDDNKESQDNDISPNVDSNSDIMKMFEELKKKAAWRVWEKEELFNLNNEYRVRIVDGGGYINIEQVTPRALFFDVCNSPSEKHQWGVIEVDTPDTWHLRDKGNGTERSDDDDWKVSQIETKGCGCPAT